MGATNLAHKLGTGIEPQQFIDGMTKNQEKFQANVAGFEWPNEADREFFESLNNRDDLRCLVLTADWCGDALRSVPVVFRALEDSGIPVEVLIKEEHMDVMEQFLTDGGQSIPIIIFADTGGFVLGQWGPRPKHVQEVMQSFKAANPDRTATDYAEKLNVARAAMLAAYEEGNGYQEVIVRELRDLLSQF